jgi:tripartite-type tricarboxylate transporter receptor subunit TctC
MRTVPTMRIATTTLAVLLALAAPATVLAQSATYPNKPIRLLVPFASGGGADVVTRPFVQKLSDGLGQSIVYENRGGAGGVLAGETVARASPDGYTLLVGAVSVMTVTVNLIKMPFDPVTDFVPITKIADVASLLAARSGFAPRTLKEMVDYAKASPGKLIWGVSGIGSSGHLAMERFRLEQGIDVTRVLYKGAGPGTLALLSNEVDIMSANPGVFMAHIKAGRLRPIAVSSAQRLSILPDLPTYGEMGFPGYIHGSWYGLVAPARTPAAIINRLYVESVKVLKDPNLIAVFTRDGGTAGGNTPQEFAREIREEIAESARVIKAAKIKL